MVEVDGRAAWARSRNPVTFSSSGPSGTRGLTPLFRSAAVDGPAVDHRQQHRQVGQVVGVAVDRVGGERGQVAA